MKKPQLPEHLRRAAAAGDRLAKKAHGPAHLLYFLGVAVESHGFYGYAAMVCLVLGVVSMIEGGEA